MINPDYERRLPEGGEVMASEMVLRIAKAVYEPRPYMMIGSFPGGERSKLATWEECPEDVRERCLSIASMAIAAMREPTEAMKDAASGLDVFWDYRGDGGGSPKDAWQAMIDEAMK